MCGMWDRNIGVLKNILELDWIEYESLVIDTDKLSIPAVGFFN